MNTIQTRRQALLVGAGSLLLAAGVSKARSPGRTPRAAHTAIETANLRTVREFLEAWEQPHLNIDELLHRYMAPNAAVRWFDGEPPVIGPKAAAESAKRTAGDQLRVAIEILC